MASADEDTDETMQALAIEEESESHRSEVGKCGAKGRAGRPCGLRAGWGTPHPGIGACKLHGGNMPNHIKHAQREIVKQEALKLGLSVEVDPATAIIQLVWQCAGDLAFYRSLVERENLLQVETGPGGSSKVTPHPWTVLYHQAEDRLANVSQAALRAGVEERRVRLAERDATAIFAAIQVALGALGVSDADVQRFRALFSAELDRQSSTAAIPARVSE